MMDKVPMRLFEVPEVAHFARGGLAKAAEAVRQGGRGGDDVLIHVNEAEFNHLRKAWGDPSINPATGLPEYGFFSKLWKGVKGAFKKFAPILGIVASVFMPALAPAIGSMLGATGTTAAALGNAAIGAATGAATGGGKGAIAGALTGGLGGSAGAIGSKFGLSGATAKLAGNALLGGASSKIRGGDFGSGAMTGAIGSVMAPSINKQVGEIGKNLGFDPKGLDSAGNISAPPSTPAPDDQSLAEFDTSQIPDRMPVNGATSFGADSPQAQAVDVPQDFAAPAGQFMETGVPGMMPAQFDPNSMTPPPQPNLPKEGIMDKIGQGTDWAKKNPGKAALGFLALQSMGGSDQPSKPKLPKGWNDPLPQYTFNRRQTTNPNNSYYTYGEMPEVQFYQGNDVGMARGGDVPGGHGAISQGSRFVDMGTGATGRADNIDAKLSEGEYVMDAETVALLGDGSLDAGAKKLDEMRARLRRHKGQALAKGKFSPSAKDATAYLGGR